MNDAGIQSTTKWPQFVAGLSAAGGAFAVGAALGWPSPVGPQLVEGDDRYFPMSQSDSDWTASVITIGCAVSCLPIGYLMKLFGRKWTMISLVLPFMVGWGLVTWAQNFIMLICGRFLIGLAGGAFCVSAPQYSVEITEKEIRGVVGTFCVMLINGGILFVYIVGAFTSVFLTNIICAMIPLVFGLSFFFMPESPVYLIIENREAEAMKSYKWLRGENYNPQAEIDLLKNEMNEGPAIQVPLTEILKRRATQRALFIGFGLMLFQQLSGINVVIFYSKTIFDAADTGINTSLQTIIVGTVLLVACFLGGLLVDRLGRKFLLMTSVIFMTITLVALGVYFYLLDQHGTVSQNLAWVPLASLCVYLIAYSIGYGPLPWLLISEVYSKDYNAIASALNGFFSWILAFAVTSSFGPIRDVIGIGPTFWMFGIFSLFGVFFTHFIVIETKARTMADIQRLLAGEKLVK